MRTQTLAPPPAGQRAPVADWRDTVGQAERRGELLTAFDLAERGLAAHPDDVWLNASVGAKPNASPAPTMPIRKPRRDSRGSFKA